MRSIRCAEVAVVADPDERLGERAVAIIRPHAGAAAPTLDEVREHLEAHGLAARSGPSPSTQWPTSPGPRPARCRSSGSDSNSATDNSKTGSRRSTLGAHPW